MLKRDWNARAGRRNRGSWSSRREDVRGADSNGALHLELKENEKPPNE